MGHQTTTDLDLDLELPSAAEVVGDHQVLLRPPCQLRQHPELLVLERTFSPDEPVDLVIPTRTMVRRTDVGDLDVMVIQTWTGEVLETEADRLGRTGLSTQHRRSLESGNEEDLAMSLGSSTLMNDRHILPETPLMVVVTGDRASLLIVMHAVVAIRSDDPAEGRSGGWQM